MTLAIATPDYEGIANNDTGVEPPRRWHIARTLNQRHCVLLCRIKVKIIHLLQIIRTTKDVYIPVGGCRGTETPAREWRGRSNRRRGIGLAWDGRWREKIILD
jgi:hypothetical protein